MQDARYRIQEVGNAECGMGSSDFGIWIAPRLNDSIFNGAGNLDLGFGNGRKREDAGYRLSKSTLLTITFCSSVPGCAL